MTSTELDNELKVAGNSGCAFKRKLNKPQEEMVDSAVTISNTLMPISEPYENFETTRKQSTWRPPVKNEKENYGFSEYIKKLKNKITCNSLEENRLNIDEAAKSVEFATSDDLDHSTFCDKRKSENSIESDFHENYTLNIDSSFEKSLQMDLSPTGNDSSAISTEDVNHSNHQQSNFTNDLSNFKVNNGAPNNFCNIKSVDNRHMINEQLNIVNYENIATDVTTNFLLNDGEEFLLDESVPFKEVVVLKDKIIGVHSGNQYTEESYLSDDKFKKYNNRERYEHENQNEIVSEPLIKKSKCNITASHNNVNIVEELDGFEAALIDMNNKVQDLYKEKQKIDTIMRTSPHNNDDIKIYSKVEHPISSENSNLSSFNNVKENNPRVSQYQKQKQLLLKLINDVDSLNNSILKATTTIRTEIIKLNN